MRAKINIQMDNAAFEGEDANLELAEILKDLEEYVIAGDTERRLHDSNGNFVGVFKIIGKPRKT